MSQFRGHLLLFLVISTIVLVAGWSLYPRLRLEERPVDLIVWPIERSNFLHEIVEKGELESGDSVDVRCEVKAQGIRRGRPSQPGGGGRGAATASGSQPSPEGGGGQFMILEVVPEGTSVQKGDVVAILDSSSLKKELVDQQISCALAEAAVVKANNDFESAQIALQEYTDGICLQRRELLEYRVTSQSEDVRQAQLTLEQTKGLLRLGFTTILQVEADQYAAEKAQVELQLAQTSLTCLNKYTAPKTIADLRAAIEVTEARHQTEKSNYDLSLGRLEELKQQIEKCEITAPLAGKVVYANKTGMDIRGAQIIIEPGAMVRDGQTIVRLPNPQSMQVKVLIDEENLALIRPGQPARFTMDALPGVELGGRVTKVNDYPEPAAGFGMAGATREFEANVSIHDPPTDLRPGMTAEVRICVNQRVDQLQIPTSAVIRHGHEHFCILQKGPQLEARRVELGPSDGKFTVIENGLREGEVAVLGASLYRDRVTLPKLLPQSGPQASPGSGQAPGVGDGRGPGDGVERRPGRGEGQRGGAGRRGPGGLQPRVPGNRP